MPATHIKNPVEWSGAALAQAGRGVAATLQALHGDDLTAKPVAWRVRRIVFGDLIAALRLGLADFVAYRSDVIFLCLVYALAGLVIAGFALGHGLVPMFFPLASGFAILGPIAGIGLYEMSKRREQGRDAHWSNAAELTHEPGFANIVLLGFVLVLLFLAWLGAAYLIYRETLGPAMPASIAAFAQATLTTAPGQAMILAGMAAGFCFALVALALGLISFPMMIDDGRVGLVTAVTASMRALAVNPLPAAAWGLLVAGGLFLGSLPLFLGLVVILPVLGHATWHLYRRLIVWT